VGDRSARAVTNVGISFLNNLIGLVSSVLISILTARFLGPRNLGVYSLIGWLTGISNLFVNLGIAFGVTKHVAELDGKNDRGMIGAFLNWALIFKISASCLITTLLIIFSSTIAGFFGHPEARNLFIVSFIALIPGGITGVLGAAIVGLQIYRYSLKMNLVFVPLTLLASVYVLWRGYGVIGLLLVTLVVSTLRMIAVFGVAAREKLLTKDLRLPEDFRKKAFRFNIGVTFMSFLDAVVWERSEVFFLGKFRPIQEVGFYSLAYSFTSMTVSFLPSAISGVLLPLQSQAFGENNFERMKKVYHKSVKYISMLSFPVVAGGIVLAEPIIRIIYGPQYVPATAAMGLLFLSSAGARVGASLAHVMYGAGLVGVKVKFAIAYAILNLGLDLLLIPSHGVWGAAIANSSTQILGVIIGPFVIRHYFKFDFPLATVIRIAMAAGVMGGAVFLMKTLIAIQSIPMLLLVVVIGAVFYAVCTLAFRVLDPEDIQLMKSVYDRLPPMLKGRYVAVLYRLENYVK